MYICMFILVWIQCHYKMGQNGNIKGVFICNDIILSTLLCRNMEAKYLIA